MTETAADPVVTLTGPGGSFEIVTESVRGVAMQVYKSRLGTMRELIAVAESHGDKEFVVQGEQRLTFADHNERVRVVAANLVRLGVEPGDRVALLSANNPEWVYTFWACAGAGAICVPLNAWWKADELQFGLEDSGAKVLVADARRWDVVRDVRDTLKDLEHVFVIEPDAVTDGARPFGEFEDGTDPGQLPNVTVAEDDIGGIFYTSGTTGRPKGATITHRQVVANVQNVTVMAIAGMMRGSAPPELSNVGQTASLLIVPLFHTTGCHATMLLNYMSGAKLVLMPPGRFDPESTMALIEKERITSIGGVPTIMWRILESPAFGTYDLSSVTRISYGGAPAAPELLDRIQDAFPNVRAGLTTAYGLTESASVATMNSGDDYVTHPGSAGKPVPTVELRIVDANGADAPAGEPGEIWLKGPTISSHGYWHRPDANAESFTDGWFHTGDIGRVDPDGFLYIVDRVKDLVIRGGENISCVEVEDALYEHPDVVDAAVVGVPHKTLGEEVRAVVQLRDGSTATAEEIRAFCAERLANFKVPEYIELVSQPLPRNPAGKVLKSALRGEGTAFADASSDSAL
jgi:long-chain acyl-CoA synthetase